LLTTARLNEENVMTMSWHTMLEFEPPIIGCVVSDRDYTFEILKTTRECVIAIPTAEMADIVVKVGNTSGRTIDKFKTFDIATSPASFVKAPLIDSCYANLECKVINTTLVTRYGFFILQVVKAWMNPAKKAPRTLHHLGKGFFMISGRVINLPSKMK